MATNTNKTGTSAAGAASPKELTRNNSQSIYEYFNLGNDLDEDYKQEKKYKQYQRKLDLQVIGYYGYLELIPGTIQITCSALITLAWILGLFSMIYDAKWNSEVRKSWKGQNTTYGKKIQKIPHDTFGRQKKDRSEQQYMNAYFEHGDEMEAIFLVIVGIMLILLITHIVVSIFRKPDMGDRELEQQGLFSTWGLVFLMSGLLEGISGLNVHYAESKHLIFVNDSQSNGNGTDEKKICICENSPCYSDQIQKVRNELNICQQMAAKMIAGTCCILAGMLLIAGAIHLTVKHYYEHKQENREELMMDPGTRLYALLQLRRAGYRMSQEDLRNPFYDEEGRRLDKLYDFRYHKPRQELKPIYNKTKPKYLRNKKKKRHNADDPNRMKRKALKNAKN